MFLAHPTIISSWLEGFSWWKTPCYSLPLMYVQFFSTWVCNCLHCQPSIHYPSAPLIFSPDVRYNFPSPCRVGCSLKHRLIVAFMAPEKKKTHLRKSLLFPFPYPCKIFICMILYRNPGRKILPRNVMVELDTISNI